MHIASAKFEVSAPDLDSCPESDLPEFAFIGRSNVGKSTLLNMLTGKRDLARVSTTPGFTKLINMFSINGTWRLVDLPGYGFAHVARQDSARFNHAVTEYLRDRPNLSCVFALLDSGLPPQSLDLEFVEWLIDNSVPFVLVFTKTDRVKPALVQANIQAFTDKISGWVEKLPEIFTCSATAREGRKELLGLIRETLAAETAAAAEAAAAQDPAATPPDGLPASARKPGIPPPRSRHMKAARPW